VVRKVEKGSEKNRRGVYEKICEGKNWIIGVGRKKKNNEDCGCL
jgi:hypothetical protein